MTKQNTKFLHHNLNVFFYSPANSVHERKLWDSSLKRDNCSWLINCLYAVAKKFQSSSMMCKTGKGYTGQVNERCTY